MVKQLLMMIAAIEVAAGSISLPAGGGAELDRLHAEHPTPRGSIRYAQQPTTIGEALDFW